MAPKPETNVWDIPPPAWLKGNIAIFPVVLFLIALHKLGKNFADNDY
jgi:hypothetical protein